MRSTTVFVKVSGDLFASPDFIEKLRFIKLNTNHLVVCVGGGTQINGAFMRRGFTLRKHGPMGRELETNAEKEMARVVLEKNRNALKKLLCKARLTRVQVVTPVFNFGPVLCHINGDEFVRAVYHGFDRLLIFTTMDRVKKKAKEFRHLPKVKIVGI